MDATGGDTVLIEVNNTKETHGYVYAEFWHVFFCMQLTWLSLLKRAQLNNPSYEKVLLASSVTGNARPQHLASDIIL